MRDLTGIVSVPTRLRPGGTIGHTSFGGRAALASAFRTVLEDQVLSSLCPFRLSLGMSDTGGLLRRGFSMVMQRLSVADANAVSRPPRRRRLQDDGFSDSNQRLERADARVDLPRIGAAVP